MKMKANPGGMIDSKDVVGRDTLISRFWKILEIKSVYLTAERRYGKTSILRKMCDEPLQGWFPILMDLEKIHSAEEFAETVAMNVHKHLGRWKRLANRVKGFLHKFSEGEVGGVLKFPDLNQRPNHYWKILLQSAIEDLVEQQEDKRLVFFWDEMPYMIDAISQRQSEFAAMEVLDVCRSLRQSQETGKSFRMVISGSIGLHHVLGKLKQKGYSNAPTNDMDSLDLPPLSTPDAEELARRLIVGEKLQVQDVNGTATEIAKGTGGVPFYIHSVVKELALQVPSTEPENIQRMIQELITGTEDKWELKHFRSRIKTYYPNDVKPVLVILDAVAAKDHPQSIQELISVIRHKDPVEEEQIRDLLGLLRLDHYVNRDTEGKFAFRSALLRRWWRYDRGL
jgi:hypothetical protein